MLGSLLVELRLLGLDHIFEVALQLAKAFLQGVCSLLDVVDLLVRLLRFLLSLLVLVSSLLSVHRLLNLVLNCGLYALAPSPCVLPDAVVQQIVGQVLFALI